jgi:hypothetical protein
MKILNKLTSFFQVLTFSIVSTLPLSAFAVIIEGNFEGRMWEWYSLNMEGTPDGEFFKEENAFAGFSGAFWYDTDLATKGSKETDPDGSASVTYSGPHDWLHTRVTGANGASFDLTSSGGTDTFSEKPYEEITVRYFTDLEEGRSDQFLVAYDDNARHEYNSSYGGSREGSFSLEPGGTFLNGLSLIQNASADINSGGWDVVGYLYFESRGTLNGLDYHGWLVGEINKFDIRVQTPEPASLLLLLGPLVLVFLRAGLITNPFSRKT